MFRTEGIREYLKLLFPLLMMTLSSSIFLLVEKVFLGYVSVQEMEVAVSVAFICQIFQVSCISLAMMAQVIVAQWSGEKNWKAIGPGIWQFIWFSIFSIFITIPVGIFYGGFFLEKAALKSIGYPYFIILLSINFLYPLSTALSCFFLGRGKTGLVVITSIGSQVVKIILAFLLILGWGKLPQMGLLGAALSTLIAQVGLCIVLFAVFLNRENQNRFQTRFARFQPRFFWECIKPGLLRVINRVLCTASWTSITLLMTSKGEEYLLIITIGGAIFFFIPFISDAICQAQTIVLSQILGSKRVQGFRSASFNGALCTVMVSLLLLIPFCGFPIEIFSYLFPKVTLDSVTVSRLFMGVWFSFVTSTIATLFISYILAFKDMVFSALMGGVNWINGFLLMYFAIKVIEIPADQFWLVLSIMHGTTALIYYLRARYLCKRTETQVLSLS